MNKNNNIYNSNNNNSTDNKNINNKKAVITYGLKEKSEGREKDYQIPLHYSNYSKFKNSYYNTNYNKSRSSSSKEAIFEYRTKKENEHITEKDKRIAQSISFSQKLPQKKVQSFLHNNSSTNNNISNNSSNNSSISDNSNNIYKITTETTISNNNDSNNNNRGETVKVRKPRTKKNKNKSINTDNIINNDNIDQNVNSYKGHNNNIHNKEYFYNNNQSKPRFIVDKNSFEIKLNFNNNNNSNSNSNSNSNNNDNDNDNSNSNSSNKESAKIKLDNEKEQDIYIVNKIQEKQNSFPSLFPHYNKFTNVHASVSLHNPFVRSDHGFRFILYRFPHLKTNNIKVQNFSHNSTISNLYYDIKVSSTISKKNITQFLKENQFYNPQIEKFCFNEILNRSYHNNSSNNNNNSNGYNKSHNIQQQEPKLSEQPLIEEDIESDFIDNLINNHNNKNSDNSDIKDRLRPATKDGSTVAKLFEKSNGNGDLLDEFMDEDDDLDISDGDDDFEPNEEEEESDSYQDSEFEDEYLKKYGTSRRKSSINNDSGIKTTRIYKQPDINPLISRYIDRDMQNNERIFGGNRLIYETIGSEKLLILSTGPLMNVLSIYNLQNPFPIEYDYIEHSLAFYEIPQTILSISVSTISSNIKIIYIKTKYSVYYFSIVYNSNNSSTNNDSNNSKSVSITLLSNFLFSDRIMDVCVSKKVINESYILFENSSIFKLSFNLTSVSDNLVEVTPFELIPPLEDYNEEDNSNDNQENLEKESVNDNDDPLGSGEEQLSQKKKNRSYQWIRFKLNLSETQLICAHTDKILIFDLASKSIKVRVLLTTKEEEKGIINGIELVEGYPFHILVSTVKYLFLFDLRYTENPLICWRNPKEHTFTSAFGGGVSIASYQHLIEKSDDLIFILVQNNISGEIFIFQYTFGKAPVSLSIPFIPILGKNNSMSNHFFEKPFQTLLQTDHSSSGSLDLGESYQPVACSIPFTPISSFGEASQNRNYNFTLNPYTNYPLFGVCMIPTQIHSLVGITLLQLSSFGEITSTVYLLQDIISTEAKNDILLDRKHRAEQLLKIQMQKISYQRSLLKLKFPKNRELVEKILKAMNKDVNYNNQEQQEQQQQQKVEGEGDSDKDKANDSSDNNQQKEEQEDYSIKENQEEEEKQIEEQNEIDQEQDSDGSDKEENEINEIIKLSKDEINEAEEVFSTTSSAISPTSSIVYSLLSKDQLSNEDKSKLVSFLDFSRSLSQHINLQKLFDKISNQNYYTQISASRKYTNIKTKAIPENIKIIDRETKKPWKSTGFDEVVVSNAIRDLLETGPKTLYELYFTLDGFFEKEEIDTYLNLYSVNVGNDGDGTINNSIEEFSNVIKPIFKTKIKPNSTLLNRNKNEYLEIDQLEHQEFIEQHSTIYHLDPFFSTNKLVSQPLFLTSRNRFMSRSYKSKDSVISKYDKIYNPEPTETLEDKRKQLQSKNKASTGAGEEDNDNDENLPQSIAEIYRQEELEKELQIKKDKEKKKRKNHHKVVLRSSFYPDDWKKEWMDGYADINPDSALILDKFQQFVEKPKEDNINIKSKSNKSSSNKKRRSINEKSVPSSPSPKKKNKSKDIEIEPSYNFSSQGMSNGFGSIFSLQNLSQSSFIFGNQEQLSQQFQQESPSPFQQRPLSPEVYHSSPPILNSPSPLKSSQSSQTSQLSQQKNQKTRQSKSSQNKISEQQQFQTPTSPQIERSNQLSQNKSSEQQQIPKSPQIERSSSNFLIPTSPSPQLAQPQTIASDYNFFSSQSASVGSTGGFANIFNTGFLSQSSNIHNSNNLENIYSQNSLLSNISNPSQLYKDTPNRNNKNNNSYNSLNNNSNNNNNNISKNNDSSNNEDNDVNSSYPQSSDYNFSQPPSCATQ